MMLQSLLRGLNRRRLKDPSYEFLFDDPHPDEVVCFDTETSGLDPKKAEILSLAAVRIRGNRVLTSQRLNMVFKPQKAIDQESIKVHRLRHVDVANGLDIYEGLDRFLRFVGNRPLVGYFLEFDVAMVNRVVKPWLGIGLPNRCTEVSALYYDYRVRGRDGVYTGNIDLRFDTIMSELKLPVLPAHDALNDAIMTALMYVKLQALLHGSSSAEG
ncbi:3'-5' exonuclease [Insolitispirillum peregrinum]|uniref:3'-5' exonuclease n=1 Tax=Insolitispirillum peregrinum TaxID=80876 RepID=UPI0036D2E1E2